MGAQEFVTEATSDTAEEAFDSAVGNARYMYGHTGYTGTIAEKDSFVLIEVPDTIDVHTFVQAALDGESLDGCGDALDRATSIANDKWGPAACIQAGERDFVFFGIASS
jgi:hypothetical protein